MQTEPSPDDKAARQARMSKALGAAFLQHRVDNLERDLEKAHYSRGQSSSSSSKKLYVPDKDSPFARKGGGINSMHSTSSQNRNNSHRPNRNGTSKDKQVDQVADDLENTRINKSIATPKQHAPPATAVQIYVLHVSTLLYGLPILKSIIKQKKSRIVVPLDTICDLDILKKGPKPLAQHAREGTRFIESKIHLGDPSGKADKISADTSLAGFVAQNMSSETEPLSPIPAEETTSQVTETLGTRSDDRHGRLSFDSKESRVPAGLPPRHLIRPFECTMYYQKLHPDLTQFVVYNNSQAKDQHDGGDLNVEGSSDSDGKGRNDKVSQVHAHRTTAPEVRASGNVASEWAQKFGFSVVDLSTFNQ